MNQFARVALFVVAALPLFGCANKTSQGSSKQQSPSGQAAGQPRPAQAAASAVKDEEAAPPPEKAFTDGYNPDKGKGTFLATAPSVSPCRAKSAPSPTASTPTTTAAAPWATAGRRCRTGL